ncbi:MAG: hypothetical protein K6C97_04195 [Treponema sp.]|nr:hypothetical protein [Treponema sp.]
MKHSRFFIFIKVLLIGIIFISCTNPLNTNTEEDSTSESSCSDTSSTDTTDDSSDDNSSSETSTDTSSTISVTSDTTEYINSSYVQTISLNQSYDISAFEGKKAFLVVTNTSSSSASLSSASSSSSVSSINYDEEAETSSDVSISQFLNEPFNPENPDFSPVISSARSLNASTSSTSYSLGDTKDFYGATSSGTSTSAYGEDSVLKVIGEHCYVWYKEKDGISVTDDQLQTLADTFDSIYEKETYIFGDNYDENCNYSNLIDIQSEQMVNLLVYDIFDDYSSGQSSGTFGYFWSFDFWLNDDDAEESYMSNECECLHLDSYFLEAAEDYMRSTIAHEFQHLLHFVNKTIKYATSNGSSSFRYSSTWFNEMMSMVCEDIMQSQIELDDDDSPKSRLPYFNANHYLGFSTWYSSSNSKIYSAYANAYTFGAFLVRNFGIDFIKELAQSTYIDETAITKALVAQGASLESFDEVLDQYYNTILTPEETEYTLNKTATKTYSDVGGSDSVTFTCSAINLKDYKTISASQMSSTYASYYYGATKRTAYYGPLILNTQLYYSTLYPYGMFASYWGTVGDDDLPTTYSLSSTITSSSDNLVYKLVFMD